MVFKVAGKNFLLAIFSLYSNIHSLPVLLQTPPASVLFHRTWCQPTIKQDLQYSVPESSQYKIVPSQKISIMYNINYVDN